MPRKSNINLGSIAGAASLAFLTAFAAPSARAQGAKETGVWIDHSGDGAVEIFPCGDKLCGKIVWLKEPLNQKGEPKHDVYNPNPDKRGRTICGLQVLGDLARMPEGGYDGGWVYDPKVGKSYSSAIQLASANTLTMTGYAGVKFLGKTFTWTRAPEGQPRCGQSGAATNAAPPAKAAAPAAAAAAAKTAPAAPKPAAAASAKPATNSQAPAAQKPAPAEPAAAVKAKPAAPASGAKTEKASTGGVPPAAPKPAASATPAAAGAAAKAKAKAPAAPATKPSKPIEASATGAGAASATNKAALPAKPAAAAAKVTPPAVKPATTAKAPASVPASASAAATAPAVKKTAPVTAFTSNGDESQSPAITVPGMQ